MKIVKRSIGQQLDLIASQYPENPAVTCGAECLTYRQLLEQVDDAAKGLLALGIRHGTHMAVVGQNGIPLLTCLLAGLRIGAVCVTSSCRLPADALIQRLRDTDTHWLFDDAPVRRAAAAENGIRTICMADLETLIRSGEGISDAELAAAMAAVMPEDTDVILFTSGTTSRPKAVLTTHLSRLNNALSMVQRNEILPTDRFCVALPMNHCFCLTANIFAPLCSGACICFAKDHHSQNVLSTIEKERCTIMHGVPTLFFSAARRQEQEKRDISSLRMGMIGGAGYTPEQFLWAAKVLSFDLIPSLGQTEATAGITAGNFDDSESVKSTTVGQLFPGIEARFCDPVTRRVLPDGEIGELCIRGYNVMQGYYGIPDSDAIDADGFLHTGDLGTMDETGNITICGRCKDIIIRGGENIAPAEVEGVLSRISGIRDVKVIGVPDDHFGEELCACVICENTVTAEEVRQAAAKALPHYKLPRYVVSLEAFPVSETGKIRKQELLKTAVQAIKTDLLRQ